MGLHRKSRLPSREVLRNALDDHPALDAIFAQILYEPKFLAILASVLLIAVTAFFFTLRFVKSPPGFRPVIKASAIDLLQARSLRRTALRAEQAGQADEAVRAWALAIAQNPAHAGRLREFLQLLLRQPPDRLRAKAAAAYGPWLLRLTQTNRSDLSLCLQLFAREGLDSHLVGHFGLWQREIPPELIVPRLRALFASGRFAAVPEFWKEHFSRIPTAAMPEAELFHAAALSAAGAGPEAEAARDKLHAAQSAPALRVVALRLQLQATEASDNLDGFEAAHQGLASIGELRFADDLAWLKLLARIGRPDKAMLAADNMLLQPGSAREALACASVLCDLGLDDRAIEILENSVAFHPQEHALWRGYIHLLIAARHWDRLEKAAARMLQEPGESTRKLAAFARYAEGLAALGQNRRASGAAAFQAIPAVVLDPDEGLALVRKMGVLGFPSEAKRLLETLVARGGESPERWPELARCAFELGETQLFAKALEEAHARNPADFAIANNYAAALLASRAQQSEALRVTTKNLAVAPDRVQARINHALALLQNGKSEQAEAWLMTVDPARLEPGDASAYHFARFELAAARNDLAAARQFFDRIELRFLLPSEIAWLNARRLRLESEFATPSSRS